MNIKKIHLDRTVIQANLYYETREHFLRGEPTSADIREYRDGQLTRVSERPVGEVCAMSDHWNDYDDDTAPQSSAILTEEQ